MKRETAPDTADDTAVGLAAPVRPLRLLLVMGNAIVGGMESSVLRLVERLPRTHYAITVLAPFASRCTDALAALGAESVLVPMPEDVPWSSVLLACAVVAQQRIDLLHAHLPNAHVLAGLAGRLTGRPVLATLHGRQLTPADLEAHRNLDTVLCTVCRHSYFHALAMGVAAERLHCVPNGVDTAVFRPDVAPARPTLRRRLGLAEDVALMGFVGRLSPEKGPELFVQAAQLLQRRCPQAHAVLVGEGPLHGAIAQQIAQAGLAGRVHLAGGCEDMPGLYPQLQLLACSSHSEAMPLAVMEAMAAGLPVVATRVGGVPDLVVHGETGWLVPPRDAQALAAQAALLLEQPAHARAMGAAARRRAQHRLELGDSAAAMDRLLHALAWPGTATRLAASGVATSPSPLAQNRMDPQTRGHQAQSQPGRQPGLRDQGAKSQSPGQENQNR